MHFTTLDWRIIGLSIVISFLPMIDRKSTRLNSSHTVISYAVFCLKKKNYRANLSPDHSWTSLRSDAKVAASTTLLWGDRDPALGRFQAEDTARHVIDEFRLQVLEV